MRTIAALGALLLLTSCASRYQPIIDPQTSRGDNLERDLADCRALAEQQNVGGSVATQGLIGAGLGAALGAIAGAISGSAGTGAAIGAAVGGGSGLASGGLQSQAERDHIVRTCLARRGYSVLN